MTPKPIADVEREMDEWEMLIAMPHALLQYTGLMKGQEWQCQINPFSYVSKGPTPPIRHTRCLEGV
jgi:hypothetical protein